MRVLRGGASVTTAKAWQRACPNCGYDLEIAYHTPVEDGKCILAPNDGTCPVVPRAVLYLGVACAVLTLGVGALVAWCIINP